MINGAEINGAEINGEASSSSLITATRGQVVTVYRAILEADGFEDLILPISSFQSRATYGDNSYLSVTVPNGPAYASDVEDRAAGDLIVQVGARYADGTTEWSELVRAGLDEIRADTGPSRASITITGYRSNSYSPKTITLDAGDYDRTLSNGRRYRMPFLDFNARPGDQATLADTTEMIIGSITYTVNASRATMELSELTNDDKLATLPW